MRIAVTYAGGEIFQHFGRTEQFKVYDVENGQVVHSEVVGTNGQGHGALAGVLQQLHADVLICGGIGGGAQAALASAGIQLYGGASGPADAAVDAFLAGRLAYDPAVHLRPRRPLRPSRRAPRRRRTRLRPPRLRRQRRVLTALSVSPPCGRLASSSCA